MEPPFISLLEAQNVFDKKKWPEKPTRLIESIECYLRRNAGDFRHSLLLLNTEEQILLFHLALLDANVFLTKILMLEFEKKGNYVGAEGLAYIHRKDAVTPCVQLVLLSRPDPEIAPDFLTHALEDEVPESLWLLLSAGAVPVISHLTESTLVTSNFINYALLFIDPRKEDFPTIKASFISANGGIFNEKKFERLIGLSKFYHEFFKPL
jgi:hypothetical protein